MSGFFYRAFEDRYRGSRALIKERLRVYLPFLESLAQGKPAPALDLGCGRGEWLELLGEAGFAARGVDLDDGMLAACLERGLNVANEDAMAALAATPDGSLAVVSAFHLVEHISFDQVLVLIAQALRALRPGGLLILETPNPENLVVGSSSFYDDPSHLRPLSPKLLAFAVEFGGFERHAVLRLQEDPRLHEAAAPRLFDVLAGASPDYSVVGQKGGPAEIMTLFAPLFSTPRGIDLHALAERYQQQQDEAQAILTQVGTELRTFSDRYEREQVGVQAGLAQVGADLRALGERYEREQAGAQTGLAQVGAALHALSDRVTQQEGSALTGELEATIAQLRTSNLSLMNDLAHGEAARNSMAVELAQLGTGQTGLAGRVAQIEAATYVQGERTASRLNSRIRELVQAQDVSDKESARLAQHVAWIEARLTHAEAEAAALRHQLAEAQQHSAPLGTRLARLFGRLRQQAARTRLVQRLRQGAFGLLRRLLRLILRSPALKHMARTLVARFPGLHTRMLRVLHAPAHEDVGVEAPADPLTAQMSPRSLAVYRELLKTNKSED
ncbi:methyltransferase domain-containing protein [Massilia sp. CMS3.1]|uniref:class I SAM-dependent methyltransferase n=1 Tax=Massilia sp. CMS3.1 TaxID=3373083 RepID=UPI003EE4FCDD